MPNRRGIKKDDDFQVLNLHFLKEVKPTIIFTLVHAGNEYTVYTYRNEHYSLMTLISHYIGLPGFGLCSGMGSCGTCMVEITERGSNYPRSALACDIPVNEELANKMILVLAD